MNEWETLDKMYEDIKAYQEDNPHIVITEQMVEDLVKNNIKELVNEIMRQL